MMTEYVPDHKIKGNKKLKREVENYKPFGVLQQDFLDFLETMEHKKKLRFVKCKECKKCLFVIDFQKTKNRITVDGLCLHCTNRVHVIDIEIEKGDDVSEFGY